MPFRLIRSPSGRIRLLLVSAAPGPAEDRLRSAGIDVTAFDCGRAALLYWDESGANFDAAMIDESAPGLSGQTLTVALRASGYRGPLIGLADDPASGSADRWLERGCDLIISKDGAPGEGLAWLAAVLARHAAAPADTPVKSVESPRNQSRSAG